MKLLFINHDRKECGIFQYGKRLSNIFAKDNRYELIYKEINNEEELRNSCNETNPDFIFYNWNLYTMSWLTPNLISYIKSDFNVKQILFQHEGGDPRIFPIDAIVMADMTNDPANKIFALPRALFERKLPENKKNNITTIGSFGFGFEHKGFDILCLRVQEEFDEAIINLHMAAAFYGDADGNLRNKIIDKCKQFIYNPKITLNITTDFITNEQLLYFLHSNDINIFMYDQLHHRTGLSSVIDYAISVEKPFGVSNSNMFRHVLAENPSINLDNNSISSVINIGNEPAIHFKKLWSNDVLRDTLYSIMEQI